MIIGLNKQLQVYCKCSKKAVIATPVRGLAWQSVPPAQTDFTEVLRNLQPLGCGLPEGELPRRGKRSHPGVRRFAPRNDSAGRNPVIKIRMLTKTEGYLITGVDRQSRFTVAAIAKDKTVESTNAAFIAALSKEKRVPPITLTLDNGTEFLGFKDLEQALDIKVYFADAHAPWQRGSNENVNGLLRFFFPRGTDFTKVTDQQLDAVLELINNRPRKCLDYLSPIELINKVLHLA